MPLDDYQLVCRQLRAAVIMLRCAQAAEPGPDRISCLWSASERLANARRIAKVRRVKLSKRISALDACLGQLDRYAGEGESIGDALGGEVHIVSRDAYGNWSERRERVH